MKAGGRMNLERIVTPTCRAINQLGGKYGEALAGRFLARVPARFLPLTGCRNARRVGFVWTLDIADSVQRGLYFTGSYDALTLRVLNSRFRAGDVFLDVGANIGTFSLPVADMLRPDGRVIAVEPAADTAEVLRSHIQANGLEPIITVVQAALSDRSGQAYLRVGEHIADAGSRTLEGQGEPVGELVRVTTADLLRIEIALPHVDVVKIDAEGHEQAVLAGMIETFRSDPPRVVVMELNPRLQQRAGTSTDALLSTMTGLGYRGRAIRYRGLDRLYPAFTGNALFEHADA
jgi:FkbM family methyltransferase